MIYHSHEPNNKDVEEKFITLSKLWSYLVWAFPINSAESKALFFPWQISMQQFLGQNYIRMENLLSSYLSHLGQPQFSRNKLKKSIQPVLNLHKYYVHFSLLRIWIENRKWMRTELYLIHSCQSPAPSQQSF